MKKIDLFRLEAGLQAVSAFTGVKWAYAVAKNLRTIAAETELLRGLAPPIGEQFKVFEEKRVELCKRHAKKNEAGEPVVVGNDFVLADQAAFNVEMTALREQYSDVVAERDEQKRGFDELLQEPADVVLHLVDLDEVPEGISAAQLHAIFEIIRDLEPQEASPKPVAKKANGEAQRSRHGTKEVVEER